MTAKEMFEELGYKLTFWNSNFKEAKEYQFVYENDNGRKIEFSKFMFREQIYIRFDKIFETLDNNSLTLDELKAINQQCKELGWLDE